MKWSVTRTFFSKVTFFSSSQIIEIIYKELKEFFYLNLIIFIYNIINQNKALYKLKDYKNTEKKNGWLEKKQLTIEYLIDVQNIFKLK